MKLLLDQNISRRIVPKLQSTFPGTSQVQLLRLEHSDDIMIWRHAAEHGYTIVTKDADFHELGLLRGSPPKVLWLKCGNASNDRILTLLKSQAPMIRKFLEAETLFCLELY